MSLRRQPLMGIVSAAAIVLVSLTFIALFDWPIFRDWVSFYLMCTIPFTFVVGAFWHAEQPAQIARLSQPMRGLAYVGLALAVGAVVAVVLLFTVGHGVTPPTPMLAQCVIISVPLTFWLAVVWGGWPFTLIRSRLVGGMVLLGAAYALAVAVFSLFFSYDFLSGAPFYSAELDPQGPFDAWTALVFIVTCMAAAFLMMLFELWPLTRRGRLMGQPVLGVVWTLCVIAISAVAVYIGIHVLGMPAPVFLTTVTVPFLFGSILVLVTLEGSLYGSLRQPLRGVASTATAAVAGVVLARIYVAMSTLVTGDVPWGAPSFEGEVWLASALLAVTFPFLAYHSDFFGMWPLRPTKVAEPAPVSGRDEASARRSDR